MTHLAIDVRFMAFKFFDLVVQNYPPAFFTYAEKCPRQALGSKDCGYYVCRYMIETIESRRQLIPDKYFPGVLALIPKR
ncbi:hypothetical protein BVRB_6g134590 isoform A [Beta vulgaris subsp. vulgaris]|nr:hypothetical protein BVRB_6g134590 isoform A [Beta vulgaris subsp. vulgaris]